MSRMSDPPSVAHRETKICDELPIKTRPFPEKGSHDPGARSPLQRFQQEADQQSARSQGQGGVFPPSRALRIGHIEGRAGRFLLGRTSVASNFRREPDTRRRLEESGFKIEHHEVGRRTKVKEGVTRTEGIDAVEIRSSWTPSWLGAGRSPEVQKKWERREALEDAERVKHPPKPQSTLVDDSITASDAVWPISLTRNIWPRFSASMAAHSSACSIWPAVADTPKKRTWSTAPPTRIIPRWRPRSRRCRQWTPHRV